MIKINPITHKDHAYESAIKSIKSLGLTILETIPINQGRYKIIKTNTAGFLYIYKEQVFMTFKRISDEKTVGESVNKHDFETAVKRGCRYIIRTTKTGNVIVANMKDFYFQRKEWLNNEGKEVYSAPISVFKGLEG